MANTPKPAGLAPVRYLNGATWNGQATAYYIPSADTNAYAIGDPVDLAGSADANGVASVVLATAGNNSGANMIVGAIVAIGTQYDVIGNIFNPNSNIAPATKTVPYYVLVADDPNIIFQIEEGGSGSALTAASVGLNCDLKSGTNNGYVSGWTLDNAQAAAGAGYQMKLLGLQQVQNNAFGTYAKWLAMINLHRYKAGVAGI